MINAYGFNVFPAQTGEEAIRIINEQANKIDIIVCDINLPDMDGFAVLNIVRKNDKLYATPFIFLTAFADEKDVRAGMNAGADDYLTKPFKVNELVKTINSRLDIRKKANTQREKELNKELANIMNENFQKEFFTPLNSILNASYLLQSSDFKVDRVLLDDCMKSIYSAGFRMFRSTRNLVLHSLIEHKQVFVPDNGFSKNITTILYDTIRYYFADKSHCNTAFNLKVENIGFQYNQGESLSIIFTELIDNAIRFGSDSLQPEVRLEQTIEGVIFSITNSVAHHVPFQLKDVAPFTKFHEDKSHVGLGLGLYICVQLCNSIGHKLYMETIDSTISFHVLIKK